MNNRVTTVSMAAQALRAVAQHTSRAAVFQEQLSTGLRINRPSDDPVQIRAMLAYRSDESRLAAENHNIQAARLTLNASVTRLIAAKDLAVRAKSIAISASSDFDRHILADQVDHILAQFVDIGNSQLGGDYLFAGTAVATSPITTDADSQFIYAGSEDRQSVVVGHGITVDTSYSGGEIFFHGDKNAFEVLRDLRDSLLDTTQTNSEVQTLMDEAVGDLDRYSNHLLNVVGEQSSALENLDALEVRNEDVQLELERIISNIQGADISAAVVQLQTEQNLLQYTYTTTARIFELNLLSFI